MLRINLNAHRNATEQSLLQTLVGYDYRTKSGALSSEKIFSVENVEKDMDRNNPPHNHRFLITQTQKQQVATFEENACNQNGKPSIAHLPIHPSHHYHFHAQLIS